MGLAMGRARMRKVGTSSFSGVSAAVGGTRAGKTEPQKSSSWALLCTGCLRDGGTGVGRVVRWSKPA